MNRERYLLVVSGPAGSGKDTVVQRMIAEHPGIECSVSATTRPPRAGEVDGKHYFFLSREEFDAKGRAGQLLESACYVDNCYGTLRSEVERRIEAGVSCVLVIEVEGAANIKRQYPECTTVFIRPPSMQELERRLRGRGTEGEEELQKRLARAREELQMADDYDFSVVNDDAGVCAEQLYNILMRRQGGSDA